MNEKKIDVLLSEMTAIRNEINITKETIHSILNFFHFNWYRSFVSHSSLK